MGTLFASLSAGAAGALTTNVLHEMLRRRPRADTPRIDLLGMQALSKMLDALDLPRPTGSALYRTTLGADLISNSLYFALVGAVPAQRSVAAGAVLGLAAGLGAVVLPPRLGLAAQTTNRSAFTQASTAALYLAGGLAAGYARQKLASRTEAANDASRGAETPVELHVAGERASA